MGRLRKWCLGSLTNHRLFRPLLLELCIFLNCLNMKITGFLCRYSQITDKILELPGPIRPMLLKLLLKFYQFQLKTVKFLQRLGNRIEVHIENSTTSARPPQSQL
ncbi:hypothetical protein BH09VER1_BH09VER1_25920 [soil metagenome]